MLWKELDGELYRSVCWAIRSNVIVGCHWESYDVAEDNVSYRWCWYQVMSCCTGGVHQTPCCQNQGVSENCLELCSGASSMVSVDVISCVQFIPNILQCYNGSASTSTSTTSSTSSLPAQSTLISRSLLLLKMYLHVKLLRCNVISLFYIDTYTLMIFNVV